MGKILYCALITEANTEEGPCKVLWLLKTKLAGGICYEAIVIYLLLKTKPTGGGSRLLGISNGGFAAPRYNVQDFTQ